MLNKIANIDSAKGYNSTRRHKLAGSYERYLQSYAENEDLNKDTVQFSPAAVFLSAVNWKLAEIAYPSENEIKMDFHIDDIHFIIDMDFTVFYKTSYQKVKLEKAAADINGEKTYIAELLVAKPPVRIFEKYADFRVDGIQMLFGRIKKAKVIGQINRYDTFTIAMLKEGIEDILYRDFINIFNVIYSFISKLGKFGINKATRFPKYDGEKIIFEKISVKNA